jgi:aspartyl-tRNA(Asn)/glutamyl-tRNA(Gln) amidotransferase subunit B
VKQRGLEQVSDTGFLDEIIGQVIAGNPDAVAKIRGGNDKAVNALKGQVMKLSAGRANPQVVGELLAAAIGRLEE